MTLRRTLSTASLAVSLPFALAACSESEDIAEPIMTTEAASSTSSEQSSTTVSTIVETVSEEESPEPETQSKGPCEWMPVEQGHPGELVSMYCDGTHASIGTYASDHVEYLSWDGKDWVRFESSGTTYTGFACYDIAQAKRQGFPAEIIDRMIPCD